MGCNPESVGQSVSSYCEQRKTYDWMAVVFTSISQALACCYVLLRSLCCGEKTMRAQQQRLEEFLQVFVLIELFFCAVSNALMPLKKREPAGTSIHRL
jgi:hypothetical protein